MNNALYQYVHNNRVTVSVNPPQITNLMSMYGLYQVLAEREGLQGICPIPRSKVGIQLDKRPAGTLLNKGMIEVASTIGTYRLTRAGVGECVVLEESGYAIPPTWSPDRLRPLFDNEVNDDQ